MRVLMAAAFLSFQPSIGVGQSQDDLDVCGLALRSEVDHLQLLRDLFALLPRNDQPSSESGALNLSDEDARRLADLIDASYSRALDRGSSIDKICGSLTEASIED